AVGRRRAEERGDQRGDCRRIVRPVEVELDVIRVVDAHLLHIGQYVGEDVARGALAVRQDVTVGITVDVHRPAEAAPADAGGGEEPLGALEVVQAQADLLHVVRALGSAGRLPRRLHGGEQQGDEYGDDRDDNEQLDQGEATSTGAEHWVLQLRGRDTS